MSGKYHLHLDSDVPGSESVAVEEMESVCSGDKQGPLPGKDADIGLLVSLCSVAGVCRHIRN